VPEGPGEVARDVVGSVGVASEKHHDEQNIRAMREEVYQKGLVNPVDLS